jgi:hypothetical protein
VDVGDRDEALCAPEAPDFDLIFERAPGGIAASTGEDRAFLGG